MAHPQQPPINQEALEHGSAAGEALEMTRIIETGDEKSVVQWLMDRHSVDNVLHNCTNNARLRTFHNSCSLSAACQLNCAIVADEKRKLNT